MNLKNIFFFFFIFCLIISLTSLNAVEDNNTIENSVDNQKINVEKDTQIISNSKEIKNSPKTIILNNTNFNNYVEDSKFNENVSDGDTIDIDGKLDSPKFNLTINKAVNLISSKNNSYISLNSSSNPTENNGALKIIKEGSGTNITGLYFHNTHIRLENTTNVHIDNITFINENASIGFGIGAISVRDGSENISITNSYFKTEQNGGHSNVVFAVAYNCLFENNTIEGYGNSIGNLFYLTTYNVDETITPHTNINITIRNNNIKAINTSKDTAICVGMVLEGRGHTIENNIINRTGIAIMSQYSDPDYGTSTEVDEITFINNTVYGGTSSLGFPGIIANNSFESFVGISKAECSNNIFNNVSINDDINFHDNIAHRLAINGENNTINNNTIFTDKEYAITITGENNILSNNSIGSNNGHGENAINSSVEYTNINNHKPATFLITADNQETFLETAIIRGRANGFTFKENLFLDNDIIIFNYTPSDYRIHDINHYYENITLTFLNSTSLIFNISNIKLINGTLVSNTGNTEVYNSYATSGGNLTYSENSYVADKSICPNPEEILLYNSNIINKSNKTFNADIIEGSNITVFYHNQILNITIPVNLKGIHPEISEKINKEGIPYPTFVNNILFNTGSENTNISNCYFNGTKTRNTTTEINADDISFNNCIFNSTVKINANNIKFTNCTFLKEIIINDTTSVNITNNTFNTTVTPIQVYNSARLTINNNIITTTADNTIIFDEDSDKSTNTVKNNQLITEGYLGNDNIITQSRIKLENNTPKYPTQIQVEYPETMFKNETVTINVSLKNIFNNTPIDSGFIEAYVDGVILTNNTLIDGTASFNFSYPENNKIIPLKIWYYDTNNKYEDNNTKININFTKTNVTIETEDFTAKLNENATITAKFTDERNNPITEGNVTIQISNKKYQTTINNGTATITEKVTEEWLDKNTFKITITENDYNKQTQATLPLNTQKGDVIITNTPIKQTNNNINFNLSIQNILKENINEGTITIKDTNNNTLLEQDITGNEIPINITPTEDNLINIEYTGEDYYSDTTQTINITIPPTETITTITIPPTAITNTPVELKATVNDIDGNPLNTGTITFTKDNETIATTQVTDGTATATAIFKTEEDTTITATYTPASTEYATSTAEASISIQKPQTILNIEDVTLTAGETVTITATLTDQLGNNINGGKVVFKVNGKTVKDANGKVVYAKVADGIATAEYTVPLDYSGKEVNITATYSGTSTYNKETTTITTTVATPQPTLTVTPITEDIQTGSTITLKAKVAAGDKAITSGKIVFKINGKTVKDENGKVIYAKVDSNGEVSVDYVLPASYKAGNYTIEAVFTGVGYDKLTGNTTMNVVKA